jgi:D-sedoheptulose 7-phosphate isomerase
LKDVIESYLTRLHDITNNHDWQSTEYLSEVLLNCIEQRRQVFICGNGGSAGNAVHLANDFLYGIEPGGNSLNIEALSANTSVLTCLGNDMGYEHIFSHQLEVKANSDDVLIVLSGSGNSPNIIQALDVGNRLNMQTFAILGFRGGKAKEIAQNPIHFQVDDMQIAEDLQLIVGHMLMQHLNQKLKSSAQR